MLWRQLYIKRIYAWRKHKEFSWESLWWWSQSLWKSLTCEGRRQCRVESEVLSDGLRDWVVIIVLLFSHSLGSYLCTTYNKHSEISRRISVSVQPILVFQFDFNENRFSIHGYVWQLLDTKLWNLKMSAEV